MKVINLVCESFNRYDVENIELPGFKKFDFSTFPSNRSPSSLYFMECFSRCSEKSLKELNNWQRLIQYKESDKFICDYVKTRMISYFWRPRHTRSSIDYGVDDGTRENTNAFLLIQMDGSLEPESRNFKKMLKFLKEEFYSSDFQHLIYWSLIGHVNFRIGEENKGIPTTLNKTLQEWIGNIQEQVIPLIDMDNTIVMIHPDHGTRRKGMDFDKSLYDSFLWVHDPLDRFQWNEESDINWADMRKTLCDIFSVNEVDTENGRSICGL